MARGLSSGSEASRVSHGEALHLLLLPVQTEERDAGPGVEVGDEWWKLAEGAGEEGKESRMEGGQEESRREGEQQGRVESRGLPQRAHRAVDELHLLARGEEDERLLLQVRAHKRPQHLTKKGKCVGGCKPGRGARRGVGVAAEVGWCGGLYDIVGPGASIGISRRFLDAGGARSAGGTGQAAGDRRGYRACGCPPGGYRVGVLAGWCGVRVGVRCRVWRTLRGEIGRAHV